MPTAHVSASCQRGFLVQRWLRFVACKPLRNVNPEESQMTSPYGICTALDGSDMEVSEERRPLGTLKIYSMRMIAND